MSVYYNLTEVSVGYNKVNLLCIYFFIPPPLLPWGVIYPTLQRVWPCHCDMEESPPRYDIDRYLQGSTSDSSNNNLPGTPSCSHAEHEDKGRHIIVELVTPVGHSLLSVWHGVLPRSPQYLTHPYPLSNKTLWSTLDISCPIWNCAWLLSRGKKHNIRHIHKPPDLCSCHILHPPVHQLK